MEHIEEHITLLYTPAVNEASPPKSPGNIYGMFAYTHPNSQYNMGQKIAYALRTNDGYGAEVVDYGSDVSVKVTYCDSFTGKSVTMHALIKFSSEKGDGIVKLNSSKWRSISSWEQAVSYLRTKMSALRSMASSTSL